MNPFKKLWDHAGIIKTFSTALFWKRFNLFLTFFWIVLVPVSIFTHWIQSTSFVSVLSLVALILASQSSWQSSRIEFKSDVKDPETDVEDPKNKK